MEIPVNIKLNPTDQLKIYYAIDDAKVNENHLELRVNIVVKNIFNYNFFQYDFKIHPEFFFGIHKFGDGTFAVYGNPISHEGKKLYPKVGFEDLENPNSITVMSLFKKWIAFIYEQQTNHERILDRNAILQAKQILYNNPSFSLDEESAKIVIDLQEKVKELAQLVELLLSKSVEHFEWRNNVYTKEEIHSKIEELNKEIDSKSKKFEVKKMFLTVAFTELIKQGFNPDNIEKLIG